MLQIAGRPIASKDELLRFLFLLASAGGFFRLWLGGMVGGGMGCSLVMYSLGMRSSLVMCSLGMRSLVMYSLGMRSSLVMCSLGVRGPVLCCLGGGRLW